MQKISGPSVVAFLEFMRTNYPKVFSLRDLSSNELDNYLFEFEKSRLNADGGESLFLRKIFPGSCSKNQQKLRDRQCLRLPRFVLLHSPCTQQGVHSLVSQ
jgi:hypothetical protein